MQRVHTEFTYYSDPVFFPASDSTIFMANTVSRVSVKSVMPDRTASSFVLCRFFSQKVLNASGNLTDALLFVESRAEVNGDLITCIPAWTPGFIRAVTTLWAGSLFQECIDMTLQVAMNGVDFVSTSSQILFCPDSIIGSIFPKLVDTNGGPEIRVVGSGLE